MRSSTANHLTTQIAAIANRISVCRKLPPHLFQLRMRDCTRLIGYIPQRPFQPICLLWACPMTPLVPITHLHCSHPSRSSSSLSLSHHCLLLVLVWFSMLELDLYYPSSCRDSPRRHWVGFAVVGLPMSTVIGSWHPKRLSLYAHSAWRAWQIQGVQCRALCTTSWRPPHTAKEAYRVRTKTRCGGRQV